MESRYCKFCQQPATHAPLDEMLGMGIEVFFCHPCQAEYLYWYKDGRLRQGFSSHSLYVTINDKVFRWTIGHDGHGQLWRVRQPGIPGVKANKGMQGIYHVPDAKSMDVNPQNIENKVRTWLPFL